MLGYLKIILMAILMKLYCPWPARHKHTERDVFEYIWSKVPSNEKAKAQHFLVFGFPYDILFLRRGEPNGWPYLNSHLFRNVKFHHRSYFITLITLCGYGCCCDYLTIFCELFKYALCTKASYRFHRRKKIQQKKT